MRWFFTLLKKIFFALFLVALLVVILYFINPGYVQKKAYAWFAPKVRITETYRDKIVAETPPVYELMQIACSLTETFRKDKNLLNTKRPYYKDFQAHFSSFQDHPLVKKLDGFLKPNPYGTTQLAIRLLSLNYDLAPDGRLVTNGQIRVNPILIGLFRRKAFLIPVHRKLIEDFARKTKFLDFYEAHRAYYKGLIANYYRLCDFEEMKGWLESHFDNQYSSYRIVFSPLTGGFHNTMRFNDPALDQEQTLMFVSAPYEHIDSLPEEEYQIKSGKISRVVFTEIDHNYVNPLTDKYAADLEASMTDHNFWNHKKNRMYATKYTTFNEYMTWGVFSLYVLDHYPQPYADSIIAIQENFMRDRRKFTYFPQFDRALIQAYIRAGKPKIEALYPPMLEWMKSFERQAREEYSQ